MAWLCLIAALTGAPMRLAEAADDLARMLAAVVEPSGAGPVDPGVGDDPGIAPWKAGQVAISLPPDRHAGDPASAPVLPPGPIGLARDPDDRPDRCSPLPIAGPAGRRLAWLQVFLF